MKVGTLLRIIDDALPILVKHGVIDSNDDFKEVPIEQWAVISSEVITVLEQHGVDVDDRVEKIVSLLPMIIGIFGIK